MWDSMQEKEELAKSASGVGWGGETDTSKASPVSHGIHRLGHKDLRVTENKYRIVEGHIAYFTTPR